MTTASLARHLEVELNLLPTESSGRRAPLVSGWRTTFECGTKVWDAFVVLDHLEFLFPNESCRAFLEFRSPHLSLRDLIPGQKFQLRADHRVIATGTVRRLLHSHGEAVPDRNRSLENATFALAGINAVAANLRKEASL